MTVGLVVVLSVFIAVIVGSSLRPQLVAAAMPEPAAWTHRNDAVDAHADRLQRGNDIHLANDREHGFAPASVPANKKPFRNTWMTRDRPVGWIHLSTQSGWMLLPVSFVTTRPPLEENARAATEVGYGSRGRSIQFCVLRC
ncbi:hypothetical protein [Mycobacterium mantenii]|uniref:hypothetical protein n=1 Tax=Mycobacterium mantenii TaxID=560555 RepID=UPI001041F1A9|nr:hypothetical protein [Mycobacterium mantenii]